MSITDGFEHIQADTAWIRLSDVIWEWFKPLNPWQVNAVKSLVSPEALADATHPLRGPGDVRNLELFVAIFPGGKARLMMSLRQLEYLQYYIKAMKLIQPTADAIARYRTAVAEIRKATEASRECADLEGPDFRNDVENMKAIPAIEKLQEEWDIDPTELTDLPLPSSKFFWFEKDFVDIVPIQLRPTDDLKRAMQNPRPYYASAKGQTTEHGHGSGSVTASIRSATPTTARDFVLEGDEEDNPGSVTEIEPEPKAIEEESGVEDREWTFNQDLQDESKAHSDGLSSSALLYQQAEQIYVAASHGLDVASAAFPQISSKPIPLGPASFLTIDFQVWEEEYGVILDVGWSACWFERHDSGEGAEVASWQEQRSGGHWIVEENQHRLNANMKCSIDGNIGRIPYVGTGESEVLPLNQVLAGVKGLVPMLHKKNLGGPVFVIMHSIEEDLSNLRHLGLPIEDWKLDLVPTDPASRETVYVIDTSEMAACISNVGRKHKVPASQCAKLECFFVMVIKGIEKCSRDLEGESLAGLEDEPILEGWMRDPDFLEALARQEDADQTILMHEAARRRRRMLARTGQADNQSTVGSDESYDSELEDERLLQEYDIEYDIGGGGPEDGIEDD